MRSPSRLLGLTAALVLTMALGAGSALASDGFRANLVVHFSSAEPDFNVSPPVVHIIFEGHGTIVGIGRVTVLTHVAESLVEGCLPSVVTHTLTAADGTLEITSNDEVCPHPSGQTAGSKLGGTWEITDASGSLAGASGSGTSKGVIGGQGNVALTLLGEVTY